MDTTRLRFLIDELEKTQKEIAADLGLSQQRFNYYVNGQREPDTDTLCRISSYFKVSVSFLIGADINTFWSTPYIEALRRYCEIVSIDFKPIINYYEQHPRIINKHMADGRLSLRERNDITPLLGGIDPDIAVCLGCSLYSTAEEYSDFYIKNSDLTIDDWRLLTLLQGLSDEKKSQFIEIIKVIDTESSTKLSNIYPKTGT